MIVKFILLSTIVLVNCVYSNSFAFRRECGENEEFKSCGSPCQKTCDNYQIKAVCPMMCMAGCQCIEGTVRNDVGHCVPVGKCTQENRKKREIPDWVPTSEKDLWEKRNKRDMSSWVPKSEKDLWGKRSKLDMPQENKAKQNL